MRAAGWPARPAKGRPKGCRAHRHRMSLRRTVAGARRRYTAEVDALGTLNLLEAIRLAGLEKTTRFYQARPALARPRCDAMRVGAASLHSSR